MKQYMVIYHAPVSAMEQMQDITPEQAKKGMEEWMKWARDCGEHLVDLGFPLANGAKLNVDGTSEDSQRQVCGYSILKADSMEQAKGLLKGHPHLSGWNATCEIEVHETMPLPGSD